jgi:hypothetical protein
VRVLDEGPRYLTRDAFDDECPACPTAEEREATCLVIEPGEEFSVWAPQGTPIGGPLGVYVERDTCTCDAPSEPPVQECEPGSMRCDGEFRIQQCNPQGSAWNNAGVCGSESHCVDGACIVD